MLVMVMLMVMLVRGPVFKDEGVKPGRSDRRDGISIFANRADVAAPPPQAGAESEMRGVVGAPRKRVD